MFQRLDLLVAMLYESLDLIVSVIFYEDYNSQITTQYFTHRGGALFIIRRKSGNAIH